MTKVYSFIKRFKKKYSHTIAFRTKKHAEVIDGFVNPSETVCYAFCGQKNDKWYDISSSCVVAVTNKRLLIGQKRILWGSRYTQITPDLYNDLKIYSGLFWGKITIDTVKEYIVISNLDKSSLDEIETNISELMMKEKKKYKE